MPGYKALTTHKSVIGLDLWSMLRARLQIYDGCIRWTAVAAAMAAAAAYSWLDAEHGLLQRCRHRGKLGSGEEHTKIFAD